MDTYINGERTSFSSTLGGDAPDATDLSSLTGAEVAGVEYYTAFSASAQYKHLGLKCGVLLIWLR